LTLLAPINKEARWESFVMAIYHARPCPKCRYYVGYSLGRPLSSVTEAPVKSFCLNCSYQLPVRAVLYGKKNPGLRSHPVARSRPPESAAAPQQSAPHSFQSGGSARESNAQRPNYARELRTIGQALETRRFSRFNLKCFSDSYFVWSTENLIQFAGAAALRRQSGGAPEPGGSADPAVKALLDRIAGVLFDTDDLKRLEREGIEARRRATTGSNGRRLSHLLRTIGEEVYRRNQRLLALSWQEEKIAVVAQNAGGGRELNVLQTDHLYDLWVRMYLRRMR
jgi:hypothetical protein